MPAGNTAGDHAPQEETHRRRRGARRKTGRDQKVGSPEDQAELDADGKDHGEPERPIGREEGCVATSRRARSGARCGKSDPPEADHQEERDRQRQQQRAAPAGGCLLAETDQQPRHGAGRGGQGVGLDDRDRAVLAVAVRKDRRDQNQDERADPAHQQHAANGQDRRVEDGQRHGAGDESGGPDPENRLASVATDDAVSDQTSQDHADGEGAEVEAGDRVGEPQLLAQRRHQGAEATQEIVVEPEHPEREPGQLVAVKGRASRVIHRALHR